MSKKTFSFQTDSFVKCSQASKLNLYSARDAAPPGLPSTPLPSQPLPRPAPDVSLLNLSPLHFKPINAEIRPADSQAGR